MMIQKLRGLGLGLFPSENVTSVKEEKPLEDDSASRMSSNNNNGIGGHKPGSNRSTRMSYGLALFEAECHKESQRKEKERDRSSIRHPPVGPERVSRFSQDEEVNSGDIVLPGDDRIRLVKKRKLFGSLNQDVRGQCFLVEIPKMIMSRMPGPPDSYVTPSSEPFFFIQALMVQMNDAYSVDLALEWLFPEDEDCPECILGLDCMYDPGRVLKLIQLSRHERCVLIRLQTPSVAQQSTPLIHQPGRLVHLFGTLAVTKTGDGIIDDALAIYWATGMVVNGFKNIPDAFVFKERPLDLMKIFKKLYNWNWEKRNETTESDWGRPELSLEQVKYGIMAAWSSRMIALKGAGSVDGAVASFSLENLPPQILGLFGRAITEVVRSEDPALHETCGILSKTADPGTLQLLQHSFRSRVKGKCVVEVNLKQELGSERYRVKSRTGKSVLLTPCQKPTKPKGNNRRVAGQETSVEHSAGHISIESIRSLTILEDTKNQGDRQSKRLWEGLRRIVRNPGCLPKHLLLALGLNIDWSLPADQSNLFDLNALNPFLAIRVPDLCSEPFQDISQVLNVSQREAWVNILTSPLSATVGPPGTGKTSLITAVAKSWIAARREENSNEVLLCSAHQNVAVRHLAETLVEGGVPGVLLLISEDYYLGWHEGFYTHLPQSVVVSTSDQVEFSLNLTEWREKNEGRGCANVIVCTVDLVGCPSFMKSLMTGVVTALIIDESSQASDVSLLRPLVSLPDLAMVSVLGDPNQLPPYSANRGEQPALSVFDLVSKGCPVNFLNEQYRMPPPICDFLSAEIYDKDLMTSPHRAKEKDLPWPLIWSHVKGAPTSDAGKTSMYNIVEAAAIARFCDQLVRTLEVSCDRVVVLTLYEEQTRRVSSLLAERDLEIPVHNVDSFQGQQCDIVLISLVVGRYFSTFAADHRRACVMLSRVKQLLCVFGDVDEVKRNNQAGVWKKLASHCYNSKRSVVVDEDKLASFLGDSLKDPQGKQQGNDPGRRAPPPVSSSSPSGGIPINVMFKGR